MAWKTRQGFSRKSVDERKKERLGLAKQGRGWFERGDQWAYKIRLTQSIVQSSFWLSLRTPALGILRIHYPKIYEE